MPNTSISFPASPAQGQQYTYGSTTYIYDGTSWSVDSTLLASPLKLDSTNNRVGINNNAPTVALDVTGAIKGSTTLEIAGATTLSSTLNVSSNLTVNTNTFFVDATNNRVGIGTTTPATTLDLGTGGQIKCPATPNPSSDANILDHYAEGTWTPKLQFATHANGTLSDPPSLTYTTQAGQYVKIGKLVECIGRLNINATGTNGVSTSWLVITGLPFPPDTSVLVYSGGLNTLYSNAAVGLRTTIGGYITTAVGGPRIILTHAAITTATGTPDTVSNIALVGTTADMLTSAYPAGKDLIFKITYIAAS